MNDRATTALSGASPGGDPAKSETPASPDTPTPAKSRVKTSPLRILSIGIAAVALVVVILGIYWSWQPATFDVAELQTKELGVYGGKPVPGTAVVAAAIGVAETLMEKPGGFVYNDIMPPGVYLDNMPNWEYGALKELRDSVRALRNDFSRSQTQSVENEHVKRADVKLAIDASSWLLPSAEEEYGQALGALRDFMRDLSSGQDRYARFYARADNLAAYLAIVEKRLGSFAVRLSESVGDQQLTAVLTTNVDGVQDPLAPEVEENSTVRPDSGTAWNQVDDIFYESRGYTWALLHMMQAISIDFSEILASKNADTAVQQIIRDLEGAAKPMVSPVVLNGHGYGFLANHSLVMASYISRANAAVLDLRILLQQG